MTWRYLVICVLILVEYGGVWNGDIKGKHLNWTVCWLAACSCIGMRMILVESVSFLWWAQRHCKNKSFYCVITFKRRLGHQTLELNNYLRRKFVYSLEISQWKFENFILRLFVHCRGAMTGTSCWIHFKSIFLYRISFVASSANFI